MNIHSTVTPAPAIPFTAADEEYAANAIAFEERFGDRLSWHPAPFTYVYRNAQLGETRVHRITSDEYKPTTEAMRQILWKREKNAEMEARAIGFSCHAVRVEMEGMTLEELSAELKAVHVLREQDDAYYHAHNGKEAVGAVDNCRRHSDICVAISRETACDDVGRAIKADAVQKALIDCDGDDGIFLTGPGSFVDLAKSLARDVLRVIELSVSVEREAA